MSKAYLPLNKNKKIIFALLFTLFFIEIIRTAWICDDAKLTMRTVLNFIDGYGPRFNIDERVQVYTHPLWFLLLTGTTFIVRNIYVATFLTSISISAIVFWLFITKFSNKVLNIIVAAAALILSKSFIDFSTSGLENPLSYLLIILLVLSGEKVTTAKTPQSTLGYFFLCALLYLCRPDLILIVLPLTVFVTTTNIMPFHLFMRSLLIGTLPAIVWTIFSLYYYGFPFPNTAYAKLETGIPFGERIEQGIIYLLDTVNRDPLTIVAIFTGIYLGIRKNTFAACLSSGLILYLLYVISIGGDFMAGRFFAVPFLLACIQISRADLNKVSLLVLAIGMGIFSSMNVQSTLLSNASYKNEKISSNGITDERGFYFQQSGLLNLDRLTLSAPSWFRNGKVVVACGQLGARALQSEPSTHLVDSCALADPLLSHIPETQPAGKSMTWRIGHFYRRIPENYLKSIELNTNLLVDPRLHAYYDSIRKVTRGDLNDPSRWMEIARINLEKPYINTLYMPRQLQP
ncbi:MAG: hypothetical protein KBD83_00560 [Gammaproteobacteria bacterium]|nr:hypothetical protein [Gammaproteobacteria bacterium]